MVCSLNLVFITKYLNAGWNIYQGICSWGSWAYLPKVCTKFGISCLLSFSTVCTYITTFFVRLYLFTTLNIYLESSWVQNMWLYWSLAVKCYAFNQKAHQPLKVEAWDSMLGCYVALILRFAQVPLFRQPTIQHWYCILHEPLKKRFLVARINSIFLVGGSLGSILGCRAEILQLDVTDVKMDRMNL